MNGTGHKQIVLIGIGNDGRSDDGLGWQMASQVETMFPSVQVIYRYQLQIEDADLISSFDTVIFVDSTRAQLKKGFEWTTCAPVYEVSFSTHRQTPGMLLFLARNLFNSQVNAYLLAISGCEWELNIGLSERAKQNLASASAFLSEALPKFEAVAAG
jgi:hydrogenase maturation protease